MKSYGICLSLADLFHLAIISSRPNHAVANGNISFFKNNYLFIYLFLERKKGSEKEGERNISVRLPLMHHLLGTWPTTQSCALTGN